MKKLIILFILISAVSSAQNKFDISVNPGVSFPIAQTTTDGKEILNQDSYFDITSEGAYNFNNMFSAGVSFGFMNLVEYKLYSFQALGRVKFYDKKIIPFTEAKIGMNIVGVKDRPAPDGNICLTLGAGAIFEVTKNFGFKAGLNYKYVNPDLISGYDVQVGNEVNVDDKPVSASMINLTFGINLSF